MGLGSLFVLLLVAADDVADVLTDSLDAWRDHLVACGVMILPLGGKSLYFRDPAENSVELVTWGVWDWRGW